MQSKKILFYPSAIGVILVSVLIWTASNSLISVVSNNKTKQIQKSSQIQKENPIVTAEVEGVFLRQQKKKPSDLGYIVDEYTLPTYAERLSVFIKNSGIGDGSIDNLSIDDFFVTQTGNLAVNYNGFTYLYTGKQVIGVFGKEDKSYFEKVKNVYSYMEIGTDFFTGKSGAFDSKYIPYKTEEDKLKLTNLESEINFNDKKPQNLPKNLEELTGYKYQLTGESYNSRGNKEIFLAYENNKEDNTYFFKTNGIAIGGIFSTEREFYKAYNSLKAFGPTKVGKYRDKFVVLLEV